MVFLVNTNTYRNSIFIAYDVETTPLDTILWAPLRRSPEGSSLSASVGTKLAGSVFSGPDRARSFVGNRSEILALSSFLDEYGVLAYGRFAVAMKKSLFAACFLAVLIGSFLGSAWYHQRGAGKKEADQGGRRVLYYVDPMNPAHTSDKPGPAPCGMPMEPVYAENDTSGTPTFPPYTTPGTARISLEKQQLIGIRVENVETTPQRYAVRTLGRVAADENLTYRVIASTDGWLRDVQGSTTGSLVQKDQLMALIDIYGTDLYNYQQQYLTYAAYLRQTGTQPPRGRLPRAQQPETVQSDAQQAEAPPAETHPHGAQPAATQQPESHQHGAQEPEGMQPDAQRPASLDPRARLPRAQQPGVMPSEARQGEARQPEAREASRKPSLVNRYVSDNNANRAKLELLNIGFSEEQIEELARTGQYRTQVEIRSPVTGFVLARSVSLRQRSEKGAELFRIADLTRVWILADVFERDAPFVGPGTEARVTIPHQGGTIEARVTDVLPQFDTATRTLKVRLEVENPDFALIPDRFVDVEFLIDHPPAITVPVDAVLDSGLKKTVFVDMGNGYFEPRSVNTGWRHGGRIEIVEGIMPGESIVVSGNFLVDSESRMKLAAAGLHGAVLKDPLCGMEIYPSQSKAAGLTIESGAKTLYFCSPECKELFEKDPAQAVVQPVAGDKPSAPPGSQSQPADKQQAALSFVKDPVCRMPVAEARAKAAGLEIEYSGKTYHFCSGQCKSHFIKAPERYADKPAPGIAQQATPDKGGRRHD
jgi:RND family efflux transporter MFP subunit